VQILWVITALRIWVAIGADTVKTFAQSLPPSEPTCVLIDARMWEWLKEQKYIIVDDGDVCPVQCDLQGNPEVGSIWTDKVEAYYLKNDLNFSSPVHEPCIYIGSYGGQVTLMGRQVDDFKSFSLQEDKLRDLFVLLKTKINIVTKVGIMCHYDGIDIVQTRDYVKIHVDTYIDKILKVHGWETASPTEGHLVEPIHPSAVRELEETIHPDTEAESLANEKAAGFPYRSYVGKLLYAYVTCHLDSGYTMGEFLKISTIADLCHYNALKPIYCYLHEKKFNGIVYWRKDPGMDLPHVPLMCRRLVHGDLNVLYPTVIDQLGGYLDAAHGKCVRVRRSMCAKVFCIAGAVIMYRAKWSVVICKSSTGRGVFVCVRGGKNA
jgi:hypothetical protein